MHDRISSGIFRALRRVPAAAIARSIAGALVTLFILTPVADAKPPAEGLEPLSRAVVAEGRRQRDDDEAGDDRVALHAKLIADQPNRQVVRPQGKQ